MSDGRMERRFMDVRYGCWSRRLLTAGAAVTLAGGLTVAPAASALASGIVVVYCTGSFSQTYSPALSSAAVPSTTYLSGDEHATSCTPVDSGIPGDNTFGLTFSNFSVSPGLNCRAVTDSASGVKTYVWNNGHTSTWKWSEKVTPGPAAGQVTANFNGPVVSGDYRGSDLSEDVVFNDDLATCDAGPLSTTAGDAEWAFYKG
jgi:hypothetical protein